VGRGEHLFTHPPRRRAERCALLSLRHLSASGRF
jgi:hypothetical protein